MRKTFAILIASTALAASAGIPAWSAMHRDTRPETSRGRDADAPGVRAGLLFASDDTRADRDHEHRVRRGDGDRHHDDDDDGEDDDDGYGGGASAGPAPAGTVAPPANGLFGGGAMPRVKVN